MNPQLDEQSTRVLSVAPDFSLLVPYGSFVYGTATERSDRDYILVCSDRDTRNVPRERINSRTTDLHIYGQPAFQAMLDDHEITALECFFLPERLRLRNTLHLTFTLDRRKLRASVSRKADHSWVKAKKKLIVPEDRNEYVAKKSLFHSFRILDYGIQIALEGRIFDYGRVNGMLDDIMNTEADWDVLDAKFRTRHLAMASLFREAAPK